MSDQTRDLTVTRFINAPPALVWKAWSEPKHFERWWIPAPMECKVVRMDLRPGGGFETLMRDGNAGATGEAWQPHVEGCFLDIVPAERIVFTTSLTEGWRPFAPWLALTAIMTFSAEGTGTRYRAHVLHKDAADSKKHEELGFFDGWGTVIDQLAKLAPAL